ncbi:MAG: flagellin N-terminal helical domain-containing protein [Helicobacteraceae bacterium]
MRVSNLSQYGSFVYDQQNILQELYKANRQLFGKKIDFGYEDTSSYIDYLRYETNFRSIEQSIDTSDKAQGFARNTDTALTNIKKMLEAYKVKLIESANATHSLTSLQAIESDLRSFRNEIMDLLNTSIGSNYLFSGTNFKQKPFDKDGTYRGNDERVNALLGSKVELPYNTTGAQTAHGYMPDYSKRITTNVRKYNQTALHPKQLDEEDPDKTPKKVPVKETDSIKDLIGNPNKGEKTYFYLRGKRPDGMGFREKFEMTGDGKVSDLLEKIGRVMGNTEIYKAVDVKLNHYGQIEITDVKTGRLMTDFHLGASNVNTDNLDNVEETKGAHVFDFNKSGFAYARDSSSATFSKDYYDGREFRLNSTLRRADSEALASVFDKAKDVFLDETDTVNLTVNGKTHSYKITATTKMEDLLASMRKDLKQDLGREVDVSLNKGTLGIFDRYAKEGTKPELNDISLSTRSEQENKDVKAFGGHDALSYDKARFQKNGAKLTSNVAQVVRKDSSYANAKTELKDVSANPNLEERVMRMDLKDKNGQKRVVEVTLRNHPTKDGHLSTFRFVEPKESKEYDIYDEYGNKTTASGYTRTESWVTKDSVEHEKKYVKGVTYEQISNIVAMALNGGEPKSGDFKDYQAAVDEAKKSVDVSLDQTGKMQIRDLTTSKSQMQFSMYDKDTNRFDNYSKVMEKHLLQTHKGIKDEQGWDLADANPKSSLDATFGFKFGALKVSGTDYAGNYKELTIPQNTSLEDLTQMITDTFGGPERNIHARVEDGKLVFKDSTGNDKTLAKLDFTFQDAQLDQKIDKGAAFSFASNNALTITEGKVDLFKTLDMAADAVKSGLVRADADAKDARNTGIQNAIAALDQLLDHVNRVHTENGSIGQALNITNSKLKTTKINVKELETMSIGSDLGEVALRLKQQTFAYQSMLMTIGKISHLNLANFL